MCYDMFGSLRIDTYCVNKCVGLVGTVLRLSLGLGLGLQILCST